MMMFPVAIMAIENDEDRAFMEEIYLQYKKLMFKYAYKVTNEKFNAEDIVSDACVSLIRNLQTLRKVPENKLKYYVAVTARNASYDYVRRSRSGSNRGYLTGNEAVFDSDVDMADVDEELIREAEIAMLREGLRKIDGKHRDVLQLKYFEQRSDEEIAGHIGIAAASVRYYLTRARRALLEALSEIDK